MSLTVAARITAAADTADELERRLLAAVTPSRAETGVITYELSRSAEDPTNFFMYEVYRDEETFAAHRRSDHVKELVRHGLRALTTSVQVTLYTRVE